MKNNSRYPGDHPARLAYNSSRASEPTLHDQFQPLHLIISAHGHEFLRYCFFDSAERIPEVGNQDQKSADEVGLVRHLINAAKNLPHRVVAQKIVLPSHVESSAKARVQCAALGAMMHEALFNKCSSFPAFGPCAQDGDQINPAGFYRGVPADLLQAFPAEHLAHAGDMLDSDEFVVVSQISFLKGSAAHS